MELEHTNLGCHCEVSDCNQRDFLPFTCDVCTKKFCLLHRTYAAHSCIGESMKDMTSMDCPICLKSIKFPKSDSADAVWNDHFLNSCSQEAGASKQIEKCYKGSCTMRLGPSNTIVCKNCRQKVCMSHRIPEDHDCQGMRGAILSKLPPAAIAGNKPSTKPPLPSAHIGMGIASSSSTVQTKATSTLKGGSLTSAGRKEKKTTIIPDLPASASASAPNVQIMSCPFCAQSFPDMQLLEVHMSVDHPDPTSSHVSSVLTSSAHAPTTSNSTISSASSSSSSYIPPITLSSSSTTNSSSVSGPSLTRGIGALGREVCPLCQARFVDPVELVMHFEQVHPQTQSAQSSSSASTVPPSDCIIS